MLIELHIVQNHSPANLNRDDLGAPKTCVFGGVTRARISSQCLKRSIRRSEIFRTAFEGGGAVRTRDLITEIARRASKSTPPPDAMLKKVKGVFESGGITVNTKGKKDEDGESTEQTDILFFVSESALDEMAKVFADGSKSLESDIAEILARSASVPDIALSGRMTEFKADKHFKGLDFTVEAALSAAHAISTHETVTEVDYFTAVDDIEGDKGAAHVNEAMFGSACFYKHFSIDWDQLVKNLGGDVDLALKTVRHFILASALANPSGKQHTFAAFNPPDGILVEVKTKRRVPMSHANAFVRPVTQGPDRDLVEESISRLGQHAHDMAVGYGVEAERFWFSPAHRHRLEYVDRSEPSQSRLAKPLLTNDRSLGSLDELVDRTVGTIAAAAGATP